MAGQSQALSRAPITDNIQTLPVGPAMENRPSQRDLKRLDGNIRTARLVEEAPGEFWLVGSLDTSRPFRFQVSRDTAKGLHVDTLKAIL